MNFAAIIPCRMDSSRLPGKPLKKIGEKTMIEHCYYRTLISIPKNNIFITSDNNKIKDMANSLKANFIKTSKKCKSATERTLEAVKKIELIKKKKIKYVLMVQGDEPLLIPSTLSKSLKFISKNDKEIVNVISTFLHKKDFENKNNVKVVINKNKEIIYYSREPIPHNWKNNIYQKKYIQTGIITFKRSALFQFDKIHFSKLEKIESIDMNRAIDLGIKIHAIITNKYTFGVDTLEDLFLAKKMLMKDKVTKNYSYK